MEHRRKVRLIAAGAALLAAGIVVMGGTSPSKDLVFERAQNDIDTLPADFAAIGMTLPPDRTRHAGLLGETDFWVGRGPTPDSRCVFVLPRYERAEAACGTPSVTLDLADGTQAVYPIPDDIGDDSGILVGGVLIVRPAE